MQLQWSRAPQNGRSDSDSSTNLIGAGVIGDRVDLVAGCLLKVGNMSKANLRILRKLVRPLKLEMGKFGMKGLVVVGVRV